PVAVLLRFLTKFAIASFLYLSEHRICAKEAFTIPKYISRKVKASANIFYNR
ncbi:34040_t:CDS:1, partial [Racocetra persica]